MARSGSFASQADAPAETLPQIKIACLSTPLRQDRTCRIAAVDDGELRLVKPVQLSDYIQMTKKKSKSRRS